MRPRAKTLPAERAVSAWTASCQPWGFFCPSDGQSAVFGCGQHAPDCVYCSCGIDIIVAIMSAFPLRRWPAVRRRRWEGVKGRKW